MSFEKNISKFERMYDARIKDSGYAYDAVDFYSHEDFYSHDMSCYDVYRKKLKTVSIDMTEKSLYNLLDYLEFLERNRTRALSSDREYGGMPAEQRYYTEIMNKKHEEEQLRKQHPALQDAWEQYEAMKILLAK